MIEVDFNNISTIRYSSAIKIVLEEQKKRYQKTGYVDINNKDYIAIKRAFFNLMLNQLSTIYSKFGAKYGRLVICADFDKSRYWRKVVYPPYKANRDKKTSNDFDTTAKKFEYEHKQEILELFKHLNMIVLDKLEVTKETSRFFRKSLEADEICAVLAQYAPEPNMIVSNDGDFKQMLLRANIKIFNPILGKLEEATKAEIHKKMMIDCLAGQAKDDIRPITYKTKVNKHFIKYMKDTHDIELKESDIKTMYTKLKSHMQEFEKMMKKLDDEEIKSGKRQKRRNMSAFANASFTTDTAKKWLESRTLTEILDEHKLYRMRYELNEQLYLLDINKLPEDIVDTIIDSYKASTPEFDSYKATELLMFACADTSYVDKFGH